MPGVVHRSAVILDSNLLLLFVVGSWNPRAISSQKRLSAFNYSDFLLLTQYIGSFRKVLTNAHISTEVSNLAGAATGMTRQAIFAQFASTISSLDEHHIAATTIASTPEFAAFGITDATISLLCGKAILLTADGRLASHLQRKNLHAYTLDQIRALRDAGNAK